MSEIKEILNQDLTNDKEGKIKENIEELEENVKESKTKVENNEKDSKIEKVTILEQTQETILEDKEAENQTNKINEKTKLDFLHKYTIVITIISVLLFVGLVVFSTVFGLINRNSNKIVNGVYINGIEVSGLDIEAAKEKLMRNISKQIK